MTKTAKPGSRSSLNQLNSCAPLAGAMLLALAFALAFAPCARATLTEVDYWRMGENDPFDRPGSANTTTDPIGGRTLTLIGAPFYDSSVGSAVTAATGSSSCMEFFSGTYGTNSPALSLTNNFGIELWVKEEGTNTGNQCLAYNGAPGTNGWGLYILGNHFAGMLGSSLLSNSTPVTGAWTHLALVRNNGTNTLYVNGVAVTNSSAGLVLPAGRIGFAANPANPTTDRIVLGLIDEARIFTFAANAFDTNDLLLNAGAPSVTTGSASNLLASGVTFTGSFSPDGLDSVYYFQYGTSTNYGSNTPAISVACSKSSTNVSFATNGLLVNTLYHFRLVASNSVSAAFGSDATFSTPPQPPAFVSASAGGFGLTNASLQVVLNPENQDSQAYVNYGFDTNYGSYTPVLDLGTTNVNSTNTFALSYLFAGCTYHYQVVASNSAGATLSPDLTFTVPGTAATITVNTTNDDGSSNSLRQAIANVSGGGTINFSVTGTITLTNPLPVIFKSLAINGPGAGRLTISGSNAWRIFFVDATAAGSVSINNLTLANGLAQGGRGGEGEEGGGGGMGAGGALFVNSGAVTVSNVSFSGNAATGGGGGNDVNSGSSGGGGGGLGGLGGGSDSGTGGGGGFMGNGGVAFEGNGGDLGGGGGGGFLGDGGTGSYEVGGGGGGIANGLDFTGTPAGGGGGGGGGNASGFSTSADLNPGGNGQLFGGGGGGGLDYNFVYPPNDSGDSGGAGGNGGKFGGGGAGNTAGGGGNGGDFGGGGGTHGAADATQYPGLPGCGGFGGGGGGTIYYDAGLGGFGGGGGGHFTFVIATGGMYGGTGGMAPARNGGGGGGGGAALGGAIFVRATNYASLSIYNSSADAGTVTAGAGGTPPQGIVGGPGAGGQAWGSCIFYLGGTNLLNVTAGTNMVAGSIADASVAAGGSTGLPATPLVKSGAGTLVLAGNNTYTGSTVVTAGTLVINGTNSASTNLQVQTGAMLSGSGKAGPVALNAGGTVAPGLGQLTTGGMVWSGAGNYNWQLYDASGGAGTGYGTVQVNGTLDVSTVTNFAINLWTLAGNSPPTDGNPINFPSGSYTWTLVQTTGGITGFNAANFSVHTQANNGADGFTSAVPVTNFVLAVSGNSLVLTPQLATAPSFAVGSVSNLSSAGATLSASVNPNGAGTTVYFLSGLSPGYGTTNSSGVGSGGTAVPVSLVLSNLLPGTAYHYQVVASNSAGVTASGDKLFTTLAGLPAVSTLSSSGITTTNALLSGTVNPEGAATGWFFKYGLTSNYGSSTPTSLLSADTAPVSVSNTVSGLSPATRYHFMLAATNSAGTNLGGDLNLVTRDIRRTISSSQYSAPGKFTLQFTGGPAGTYTVLTATNLNLPPSNWTLLGPATLSNNLFQFIDTSATNSQQFYMLKQQ